MNTLSLMIHVLAATILVGPQVLMFYAVTPATWMVEDERLKRDLVRVVAGRFAKLAGVAIVLLIATGLYQFYSVVPEAIQGDLNGYRFGMLFMLKMTLVVILLVLIVVHGVVIGRRIGRLADEVIAGTGDPAALESARRSSFAFSTMMLIVSISILLLGVALGYHDFSYAPN